MQNYLGLGKNMNKITLKTSGSGKIQINTIIPETSNGWEGMYSPDCPVTLTAVPDENAVFTGWSGDLSGTDATVTLTLSEAMSIQANFGERQRIMGDVNADGVFNISDAVLMQKWLHGISGAKLKDMKAGDLREDGRLNIFDLCIMKSELMKK